MSNLFCLGYTAVAAYVKQFSVISWVDAILVPFFIVTILGIAIFFRNWRYANNPVKKYFLPALALKMLGGLGVGLVYEFYYSGGGDTFGYYKTIKVMEEAFWESPKDGFNLLTIDFSDTENYTNYDLLKKYGSKMPFWGQIDTYSVCRVFFFFGIPTFGSYYALSIFSSVFSFIGVWGLFRVFVSYYPMLIKQMAIAVLFIPSVVFWGSGVLKDSITLGMLGMLVYLIYKVFIKKKLNPFYLILLFVSGYMIYLIKPYIVISFIPFAIFWVGLENQSKIPNALIRFVIGPVLIVSSLIGGYFALIQLSEGSSRFSVDNVAQFAAAHRNDMLNNQDYYRLNESGGSRFDIGSFEATPTGILVKFPIAVFTTFFRPTIFETRSPLIFISAIENAYLLYLTIIILYSTGLMGFFRHIIQKPILIFSFFFSIAFAFSVGLATSNFGALVRYKIPCIPFFVASLFIVNYLENERKRKIKVQNELFRKTMQQTYQKMNTT
ncbi:MAG: hypothetical protein LC115_08400 [Bacteroidia bacterium]|nr:hypothetical protein [Bacteroidia bacterium]